MSQNYKIFAGTSHPELAQEIADILGVELGKRTIKRFSCGEIYVNYDETIRGQDVFIVQTARTNYTQEDMMELFLLCDAAKRSFAKSVRLVVPYFPYSRQDKIHSSRESISARLMADLTVQSGADHVITMHLHADQIQGFFSVPVDNLNGRKMLVDLIKEKNIKNPVFVSPDAGGAKMVKQFANELDYPMAILHKTRPDHNVSEVTHIVGDVEGKTPIIVDDMVDTAGSICGAKQALVDQGANDEVYMLTTHPIFSGPAVDRMKHAGFKEVICTNTLPLEEDQHFDALRQVSVAPLMAEVIKNTVENRSVSSLYY